jgi:hypothetical protein
MKDSWIIFVLIYTKHLLYVVPVVTDLLTYNISLKSNYINIVIRYNFGYTQVLCRPLWLVN